MKCCEPSKIVEYKCCSQERKDNDKEPDALDLFNECHYNKKNKGFTSSVQSAIVRHFAKTIDLKYAYF